MTKLRDSLPVAIITESDEETRLLIRSLLELLGFVVIEARDEKEMYDSAVFYQPDLILIELATPVVTSFSTIRRIKKHAELSKVHIVAISGTSRGVNGPVAMAAGCSAHVRKPIEFDQLESVVESLIPCERLSMVSLLVH